MTRKPRCATCITVLLTGSIAACGVPAEKHQELPASAGEIVTIRRWQVLDPASGTIIVEGCQNGGRYSSGVITFPANAGQAVEFTLRYSRVTTQEENQSDLNRLPCDRTSSEEAPYEIISSPTCWTASPSSGSCIPEDFSSARITDIAFIPESAIVNERCEATAEGFRLSVTIDRIGRFCQTARGGAFDVFTTRAP